MMERYTFFRDEDERTLAVIGAEAIETDMRGNYQKPYAVLTSSRLYCKGDSVSGSTVTHGNFITDITDVLSARIAKPPVTRSWALWIIAGLFLISCALLMLNAKLTLQQSHDPGVEMLMMITGVTDFYHLINPTFYVVLISAVVSVMIALVAICLKRKTVVIFALILYPIVSVLCWMVVFISLLIGIDIGYILIGPLTFTSLTPNILNVISIVVGVLYYKRSQCAPLLQGFLIQCASGAFCFAPSEYRSEELTRFEQQVAQVKAEHANGKS